METKISAEDLFPILTLFLISETFFWESVLESISYIAFSSERVRITLAPLDSKSFWIFKVILKLIEASVVPLELWAPSSGNPWPASKTITLFVTGTETTGTIFTSVKFWEE